MTDRKKVNFQQFQKYLQQLIDELKETMSSINQHDLDSDVVQLFNQVHYRGIQKIKNLSGFLRLNSLEHISRMIESVIEYQWNKHQLSNENQRQFLETGLDLMMQSLSNPESPMESIAEFPFFLNLYKQIIISSEPAIPDDISLDKTEEIETIKQSKDDTSQNMKNETTQETYLSIKSSKLDQLFEYVSELLMADQIIRKKLSVSDTLREDMQETVTHLELSVQRIREIALSLRLVPVSELFSKLKRLTRDLSRELNKEIELIISGDQSEIDKNMVDSLHDPLVHLIRNSLDHGFENPEERKKAGKPVRGKLYLSAAQKGNQISISVKDDGKGLNRKKILKKAQSKGLINEELTELSDDNVWQLLFNPGFSTADTVSELSGRGVGLDVVKQNVEMLRGSVEVNSSLGKGSEFSLNVPLTLAIIDCLIVTVGNAKYAVPIDNILETVDSQSDRFRKMTGGSVLDHRDGILPVISLESFFDNKNKNTNQTTYIIVIESGKQKVGLEVDNIDDQQQIVVKPLPAIYKHIEGVSGCTLLSDGTVGLIIDVEYLVRQFN